MATPSQKKILAYADWAWLKGPRLMGTLVAAPAKGKEVFFFHYDPEWLKSGQSFSLDPRLQLFAGPQYPKKDHPNFGIFLDSSPDRWGRALMNRREAQRARQEKRDQRTLLDSDYLLGVFDGHRMGALRFKFHEDGAFLDDDKELASPPWARLRDLEYASLQLERDKAEDANDYEKWLKLLVAPGGSLGGARPKASVIDEQGGLWIAKFPSLKDEKNAGAWEYIASTLARNSGIQMADAEIRRFSGEHDTFLTRRFDRGGEGRIHFASAMTLLERTDGSGADEGVSYLDIVGFIQKNGAQANKDLEQLWRRIVFSVCISNVDDHLRNHGFLLTEKGWVLSPAFDLNPSESGDGLKLNVSENDNAQSLELTLEVAEHFRVKKGDAVAIQNDIVTAVRNWRDVASRYVSPKEISAMEHAFRVVKES